MAPSFDFRFGATLSGEPSHLTYEPGPQQSRKPVVPSYSPQTLLNPKAAAMNKHVQYSSVNDDAVGLTNLANGDIGSSRMIESLHGVTEREDVPQKKRKAASTNDDGNDSDGDRKKQNRDSSQFSNGGMIGSHLKAERQEFTAQSGPATEPIDLTNDDDEEVQIIKDDGNTEVCLGDIHTTANAFRVPAVSQSAQRNIPKTHWPAVTIGYRRVPAQNFIIDVNDATKTKFGTLEIKAASALCQLLDGRHINKLRLKMTLLSRKRKSEETAGMRISAALRIYVQLFCPRRSADQVGRFLSQKKLYLQPPLTSGGREVHNPQEPKRLGAISKTGASQPQTPTYYVSRTVEEMRREANNMFDKLAKNESLPAKEADSAIIKTALMDHQKKALHFLTEHEREDFEGDEIPAHMLWKSRPKNNGQPAWYHVITGQEVTQKPVPIQGGILADMMGLGKTLSILALIAETKLKSVRFRQSRPADDGPTKNATGTLLICPKSVLSNWEEQIRNHCVDRKVKVYNYHGNNRSQNLDTLAKFDVVLTTYQTAANEFSDGIKKKSALMDLNWFRIVLDEAHSIRNQSTKIFKGCCALHSARRWAVTGTPVQNTLYDLGALVKFLRIPPFDNPHAWNQYIMSPFKSGNVDVVEHLQLLVGSITLRRLKDTIGDGLPDRRESMVRLQASESERILYKQFASISRSSFHNITGGGNQLRGKAYAHVLKSIGRLRAICAHGREMLSDEDMKDIESEDADGAIVLDIGDEPGIEQESEFISDSQAYSIYKAMKDSEMDKCESCSKQLSKSEQQEVVDLEVEEDDDSEDSEDNNDDQTQKSRKRKGRGEETGAEADDEDEGEQEEQDLLGHMTPCFHLICTDCTARYHKETAETMTADRWIKCPFDEAAQRFGMKEITRSGLQDYIEEREMAARQPKAAKWDEESYSGPHTKVKALLNELKQSEEESSEKMTLGEPPIRSVVFSGWTSYLDLIEHALVKNKIGLVRLDGTMSIKQRSNVLEIFKTNPKATVMLVSIKAGGQGLNFTSANKVYVMEPQFNPGVSQQAVDRVHRLGQKRDVQITHYIMENSIEEGILDLQKKKIKLAQMSMDKKRSKAEENKERMEDLRALFK